MTPLEHLLTHTTIGAVDGAGAAAFLQDPRAGLLLLPGDPMRPEVADVAVVLTELHDKFPALRVAVAPSGSDAEPAQRAAFGVTTFPSLLFVRGGEVKERLSRMQSWSTYVAAAMSLQSGAQEGAAVR